jgi:hypothetical protein
MKLPIKPLAAAVIICALAAACTVRSNTTVEKPVPSTTAYVVPASPAPTTAVVVRE